MDIGEEVREYDEFKEEIRSTLEDQYTLQILNKDYYSAYETVKTLMAYKMIEANDYRLNDRNNIFKGVDVRDRSTWGVWDYRRVDIGEYIPKYLYSDLKYSYTFKVLRHAHWGIRVEGNYEGKIRISYGQSQFRVKLLINKRAVRNSIEWLDRYLYTHKVIYSEIPKVLHLAQLGMMPIYTIEYINDVMPRHKLVGIIIIKLDKEGSLLGDIFIEYSHLYNNWVDISQFIDKLNDGMIQSSSAKLHMRYIVDCKEALQTQISMVHAQMDIDKEKGA